MLVNNLVPITLRNLEDCDHHAMRGVQQLLDLVGAAAFDHVDSNERHMHPPPSLANAIVTTSHGQNNAKLCLAAHHPGIGLVRPFERIGFYHWTDAGEFGEVQCILGVCWCSRVPTLQASTCADELYRCDLNGIECRTNH